MCCKREWLILPGTLSRRLGRRETSNVGKNLLTGVKCSESCPVATENRSYSGAIGISGNLRHRVVQQVSDLPGQMCYDNTQIVSVFT
jgi:hypothetical protein